VSGISQQHTQQFSPRKPMSYLRTCLVLLATASVVESISCNQGKKVSYSSECSASNTDTFAEAACLFGETTCITYSHWWTAANGCVTSTAQGACSNGLTNCEVQDALYDGAASAVYKDYTCTDTCTADNCNGNSVTDPNGVTPFTCNTGTKTKYGDGCGSRTDTDTFASTPCIAGEESCVSWKYYTEASGGCTTSITTGLCTNVLTECAVQDALYADKSGYKGYSCAESTTRDGNSMATISPGGKNQDASGSVSHSSMGVALVMAMVSAMQV